MTQTLALWANDRRVAELAHEAMDDQWSFEYDAAWLKDTAAFPLSPVLPLTRPAKGYPSIVVKRFIENLLPEGRALEVIAATSKVARSNVYALIAALGAETTGAFRFWPAGEAPPTVAAEMQREVTREELQKRLDDRALVPLAAWDGKIRMSIAGVQDKLPVYLDKPLDDGGRMYLAAPPLASTHILKPEPQEPRTPHLVVNEHFCMSLARRMGLPVAGVRLYRAPTPVLVVERFDRVLAAAANPRSVQRLHIIDACQATDKPAAAKYEHNLGTGAHVRAVRDGMSFEILFRLADLTVNKAVARRTLLRWAFFQFLIGNTDAHGKNFSFYVRPEGLEPAPWYDLVSVVQYLHFDHELAMAWGDEFALENIKSFAMADFARRCKVDRGLLRREATRMSKLAIEHATLQASAAEYDSVDEQAFAGSIRDFVIGQAERLPLIAAEAAKIKEEYL